MRNAALAYARLSDPEAGGVYPASRAAACMTITQAMMSYPEMVAGPGRFDLRMMQVGRGRILAKGGAEGYQAIGLMPGAMGPGSPACGIALKIADGDNRASVRSSVAVEVLRQLGALSPDELEALAEFGPSLPVLNVRKLVVGQGRTCFRLNIAM